MGRQGLKGIAPIGDNLYVMNDDGLHVIKLLEIIPDTTLYNLQIIAGQVGIEGKLYHEQGTQALLSRPGR